MDPRRRGKNESSTSIEETSVVAEFPCVTREQSVATKDSLICVAYVHPRAPTHQPAAIKASVQLAPIAVNVRFAVKRHNDGDNEGPSVVRSFRDTAAQEAAPRGQSGAAQPTTNARLGEVDQLPTPALMAITAFR